MTTSTVPKIDDTLDFHSLNAMLNLYDDEGGIQFDKDREATRRYFLDHVNQNTVYFHDLEEKFSYLLDNHYYDPVVVNKYDFGDIKELFKQAYAHRFRFQSFLGAYKYYAGYTLKTFDGARYLERFEDRVCMTALTLADGDIEFAQSLVDEIITGRFQPATPTFLNAGKAQRGEHVSCFLLRIEDNMESIGRSINSSLQLSKRGGGVALLLSNLREHGAAIKKVENQSSGVVPVMKMLEDAFSYANQLGARQGAGAVYLNVHHPDILSFLDTKRENADEKIRIKTLSLGVVIPDITFELAKRNDDMYLFSPYDVEREYGTPFADISITDHYHEMVENPHIRKKKINARALFQTLAELQFESGYPYIMFEDTVNKANPIEGRVNMSNLCVTGDTRILTSEGYRTAKDLYDTQEDFSVVVDERARTLNMDNKGGAVVASSRMFKTAEAADIYKVTTFEGFDIRATEWHKFYVERDGSLVKIPLHEVELGDKLLVQGYSTGPVGGMENEDLAYLTGVIASDGTFNISRNGDRKAVRIDTYGDKHQFQPAIRDAVHRVLEGREDLLGKHNATLTPEFRSAKLADRDSLTSAPLGLLLAEHGFTAETKLQVPEFVWRGDARTKQAYLNGVWQMDGCITGSVEGHSRSLELGSRDRGFLQSIQMLLLEFGVFTRMYASKKEITDVLLPDGKGGTKTYSTSPTWTLRASTKESAHALHDLITWREASDERWDEVKGENSSRKHYETHKFRATVASIEFDGIEDVYDPTVDDGHSVIYNGVVTGQCSEILQVNTASVFNDDLTYAYTGEDISCNLGSMNIAMAMDSPDFEKTVETAVRSLTFVSEDTRIDSVPSIRRGNDAAHAIGLGQMNLHGFLGRERIYYGSEEGLDFTNAYFASVLYQCLRASNKIARERGCTFEGFDESEYASGEFFDRFDPEDFLPKTDKVKELFANSTIHTPTKEEWDQLKRDIMSDGIYNRYLQAVPPTGSISYINNSTSSIHPIASKIEIRKEGKIGRVYYPAPHMTNENLDYYQDAYEIGYEKLIDTYATATKYVDQGLSLTLFFKDTATTRDINRAQIYAWRKGIKTLYYIRLRQAALEGTSVEGCVSCML